MSNVQSYPYSQPLSVIMWESYSAKEFLPVLNLNEHTFRQWGKRKNIELPFPGTGHVAKFTGHEIVYIAALATLSVLQSPPSMGKTGLKKQVEIFTDAFVRGITSYRYCVAKTRPLGDGFMEWALCDSASPEHHVVDYAGGKKVPGWIVLDLLEIAENTAKGLSQVLDSR